MYPLSNKLFIHKWENHFNDTQKHYIWTIINGLKLEDTLTLPYCELQFSLTTTFEEIKHIKSEASVEDIELNYIKTVEKDIDCQIKANIKLEETEFKFQCSICGKFVKSKYLLDKHLKLTHASNTFTSEFNTKVECPDKLVKALVPLHDQRQPLLITTITTEDGKSSIVEKSDGIEYKDTTVGFTCEECGKTFTRLKYYESHKKRHSEPDAEKRRHKTTKVHLCNYCGKSYKDAYNLRMHLFLHTGERPLKCDICGKGFVIKKILTEHMYIHSGQKPFLCDVEGCDKAFTHSTGKRQHYISVHSNIKRFECEYCQKRYAKKTHLK